MFEFDKSLPENHTAPGLVDLQVNGYAGLDFNGDPDQWTPESWQKVRNLMERRGVVVALPTFITDASENLIRRIQRYKQLIKDEPSLADFYPALHIEGPFISPDEGPRGAHPLKHCRTPIDSPHLIHDLMELAEGSIALVTLAPELPGAIELIELLVEAGIKIALGHTNASQQHIQEAVQAGATLSTHLGNGSHQVLPRHDNYIQTQLANDALYATFIADGHHIPAPAFKNFLRAKTPERTMLITDAMAAADLGPGSYTLGAAQVEVSQALRVTLQGHEGLAGSALTLDRGILFAYQHTELNFDGAWALASVNPARFLNLPTPPDITVQISAEGFDRIA